MIGFFSNRMRKKENLWFTLLLLCNGWGELQCHEHSKHWRWSAPEIIPVILRIIRPSQCAHNKQDRHLDIREVNQWLCSLQVMQLMRRWCDLCFWSPSGVALVSAPGYRGTSLSAAPVCVVFPGAVFPELVTRQFTTLLWMSQHFLSL